MSAAPFYADVAEGPADGRAVWFHAADGVRLRAGIWNSSAPNGTVIVLPGRTEYVEKYGRTASDLAARGYATLSIDWRGQGLSDRALADPMTGHVGDFAEYQGDLAALMALADRLALPGPRFLLAHSMGGCIGLRGLSRGIAVQAAAFSAPMWGILLAAWMRPVAQMLSQAARWFSFDHRYAPGTGRQTYVVASGFAGNLLTTDPDMWAYMNRQAVAHPDLTLAGPSLGWLHAALAECHALSHLPAPACPAICALGTSEKVIDTGPVHLRMRSWPGGRLALYAGSEHEVLMEAPQTRARFLDAADALFQAHSRIASGDHRIA